MDVIEKTWTGVGDNNHWYEIDESRVSDKKILDWIQGGSLNLKIGELYATKQMFYFVYESVEDGFTAGTQFVHNYAVNSYTEDPKLRPYIPAKSIKILEPEKPFIVCEIKTIRSKPFSFPLTFSYEVLFLVKILSEGMVGWLTIDGRLPINLHIKQLKMT